MGIYKEAIETLSDRAQRLGANCIVGLRTDIDEISGKGTQMLKRKIGQFAAESHMVDFNEFTQFNVSCRRYYY